MSAALDWLSIEDFTVSLWDSMVVFVPSGDNVVLTVSRSSAWMEALAALLDLVFDLAQQCLAVRDRQLVVVGMDFGKGEKAVAVTAVVDKGRLQ